MANVTVVGLGEAGAIYARGLYERGYDVRGYDPFTRIEDELIQQFDDLGDAVAEADVIVTLVGARAAKKVFSDVLEVVSGNPVIADFNTGSPEIKGELEATASERGIDFADVAVLAPVPRDGVRTPLMVSGSGAARFAALFEATGASVEVAEGPAGNAAAHKLLRSVFMKGLAGIVIESLRAAEYIGAAQWLRQQMINEMSGDADYLIGRLVEGSQAHAGRRAHEVGDTADYLRSIGQRTWMTEATKKWLEELERENNS